MQKKEHPVPVIKSEGEWLQFFDDDDNPFQPDSPVHYQIVGEDGSVLKEGDLTADSNKVSMADLGTKKFAVFVENWIVGETEGFEPLEASVEGDGSSVDLGEGRDFGTEVDWELAAGGTDEDESGDESDGGSSAGDGDSDDGGNGDDSGGDGDTSDSSEGDDASDDTQDSKDADSSDADSGDDSNGVSDDDSDSANDSGGDTTASDDSDDGSNDDDDSSDGSNDDADSNDEKTG